MEHLVIWLPHAFGCAEWLFIYSNTVQILRQLARGGRNRLCTSVPNSFKKSFFITSVFLEVQSERKAELHNTVKHHDWVVCSVQFMPVTPERGTGTGRENPINV